MTSRSLNDPAGDRAGADGATCQHDSSQRYPKRPMITATYSSGSHNIHYVNLEIGQPGRDKRIDLITFFAFARGKWLARAGGIPHGRGWSPMAIYRSDTETHERYQKRYGWRGTTLPGHPCHQVWKQQFWFHIGSTHCAIKAIWFHVGSTPLISLRI